MQINNSLSTIKGTLRGVHYQLPPSAEVKVVRAVKGALWDVIVDLRAGSPTYGQWFGAELNEDNRLMMYVPRGFGHGFVTLTPNVEAFYLDSAFYAPGEERGLRWNDPAISDRMAGRANRDVGQGPQLARSRRQVPRRGTYARPWMKVLLTGASSFTGYWFASALNEAGANVVAPLRGALADYREGARAERVRRLSSAAEIVETAPFGSDRFFALAKVGGYDILCHHAAQVGDYRSVDFDIAARWRRTRRTCAPCWKRLGTAASRELF